MTKAPLGPNEAQGAEVAVAGGGPTGLWMACELALAGVRVIVLERLAEPTGLSKAMGLHAHSMEMLEYRGVLDRFTAGNPTPLYLNFAMFPLDLRTLDFPHPYGVIIPQARTEALPREGVGCGDPAGTRGRRAAPG